MKSLGRHLIVEMYGCLHKLLTDLDLAKKVLRESVESCGATYMGEFNTIFDNGGFSYIILIAESHISIHTWPEYNYIALDIFTCGEKVDPWKAYEVITRYYQPSKINIVELKRGIVEEKEQG
ncbi:MAG: adenosylmethionine decarboxylase [Nitrososphaerota archaeon]